MPPMVVSWVKEGFKMKASYEFKQTLKDYVSMKILGKS